MARRKKLTEKTTLGELHDYLKSKKVDVRIAKGNIGKSWSACLKSGVDLDVLGIGIGPTIYDALNEAIRDMGD